MERDEKDETGMSHFGTSLSFSSSLSLSVALSLSVPLSLSLFTSHSQSLPFYLVLPHLLVTCSQGTVRSPIPVLHTFGHCTSTKKGGVAHSRFHSLLLPLPPSLHPGPGLLCSLTCVAPTFLSLPKTLTDIKVPSFFVKGILQQFLKRVREWERECWDWQLFTPFGENFN